VKKYLRFTFRGFPYASGMLPKHLFENLRTFLFIGMIVAGVGPLIHLHVLDGGYVTFERTKFVLFGCIVRFIQIKSEHGCILRNRDAFLDFKNP
jgi:hypothetical protein